MGTIKSVIDDIPNWCGTIKKGYDIIRAKPWYAPCCCAMGSTEPYICMTPCCCLLNDDHANDIQFRYLFATPCMCYYIKHDKRENCITPICCVTDYESTDLDCPRRDTDTTCGMVLDMYQCCICIYQPMSFASPICCCQSVRGISRPSCCDYYRESTRSSLGHRSCNYFVTPCGFSSGKPMCNLTSCWLFYISKTYTETVPLEAPLYDPPVNWYIKKHNCYKQDVKHNCCCLFGFVSSSDELGNPYYEPNLETIQEVAPTEYDVERQARIEECLCDRPNYEPHIMPIIMQELTKQELTIKNNVYY